MCPGVEMMAGDRLCVKPQPCVLNIHEGDGSTGRVQSLLDGLREEIGRDIVTPLMDNDGTESRIKALDHHLRAKTTLGNLDNECRRKQGKAIR